MNKHYIKEAGGEDGRIASRIDLEIVGNLRN